MLNYRKVNSFFYVRFDRHMKPEPHFPPAGFHIITEMLFTEIRHGTTATQRNCCVTTKVLHCQNIQVNRDSALKLLQAVVQMWR